MQTRLRRLGLTVLVLTSLSAIALAVGTATASAAGTCALPATSTPLSALGDMNQYFLAPGGSFEGNLAGWNLSGGASVVSGNESWNVQSAGDSYSLALPTTSTAATTSTFCVTTDAPSFRMFIKNNGNQQGVHNGQLAVYLNFTGLDGHAQQVKIAALTVPTTAWTLSPSISFIQYLSTPLKSGSANISFTIKPNDNHGNWQVDDLEIDPYHSR